jgi:hypothetical protein
MGLYGRFLTAIVILSPTGVLYLGHISNYKKSKGKGRDWLSSLEIVSLFSKFVFIMPFFLKSKN